MKNILMVLVCTLLLFGCSLKTKTESKIIQTVGIVGVTSVSTIIYSVDKDSNLIKLVKKGFETKKSQNEQIETPDLTLTFINDDGKKEEFQVNYKQRLYSYKGNIYKLDSKTTSILQEQFMN
ncbi:DUF438 domain-containing protein [Neobacillus niacini]|uniref:hypothetical protein n=1 Tax=Neobacillus driksii TaxID=3035913 RepID=UPI002786AB91|nr:hypothetical protein [Neobacillus niacini]MDQ0971202.1 DUF438 domain-containing protein [Neobacillus niacini]